MGRLSRLRNELVHKEIGIEFIIKFIKFPNEVPAVNPELWARVNNREVIGDATMLGLPSREGLKGLVPYRSFPTIIRASRGKKMRQRSCAPRRRTMQSDEIGHPISSQSKVGRVD